MVIFYSYVKLPEGNPYETWIDGHTFFRGQRSMFPPWRKFKIMTVAPQLTGEQWGYTPTKTGFLLPLSIY